MRTAPAPTAATTLVRGRRALALAVALTLPLLSACGPDEEAGFEAVSGEPGAVQVLVGAPGADAEDSGPIAAALDAPQGVAVNQGVRYVSDTGHTRVLRIAKDGTCVLTGSSQEGYEDLDWCTGARPTDLLQNPTALAIDTMGDVFIADPVAKRVFVVQTVTRNLLTVAGTGTDGLPVDGAVAVESPLRQPSGLAVTADGDRLYIADGGAGQVLVVDTSGVAEPDPSHGMTPPRGSIPTLTPLPNATSSAPSPTATPVPVLTAPPVPVFTLAPLPTSLPTAAVASPSATPAMVPSRIATATAQPSASPDPDATDDVRDVAVERATVLEDSGDPTPDAGDDTGLLPEDDGSTDTSTDGSSAGDDDEPDTSSSPSYSSSPRPSSSSPSPVVTADGLLHVVAGTGCAPTSAAARPAAGETVPALSAALTKPTAVALDGSRLVIADSGNHQVYLAQLGESDEPVELTTTSSDDPALLQPVGLALLDEGSQLVAVDAATHAVLQTALGEGPATWSVVSDALTSPSAVAADRSAVLVADSDADAVVGITLPALVSASSSPTSSPSTTPLPRDDSALRVTRAAVADDELATTSAPAARAAVTRTCAAVPATTTPSAGPSTSGRDPVVTPAGTPASSRPTTPSQVSVPGAGAHRMAGADRIATAVATSQQLFPKGGSAPVVVISSSTSFADAAGGARLAAELGGPLLLTPGGTLDASVAAEVARVLSAGGSVVVVGGEKAVSAGAFDALQKIAPDRVERVSGDDRYSSAVALADRLTKASATSGSAPIYLVTGTDHPDALVVVALARRTGGVVVLSQGDRLPAATRAYLVANDPTGARTVPVGGAAAKAAATLGGEAGRTASAAAVVGTDRYDTARKVAERFAALDSLDGTHVSVVGLATGTDWPDALTGSTAMGTLVGPLLLTHGSDLDPAAAKALAALPGGARPTTFLVFGGEKAVSPAAEKAFGKAAQG